MKNKPFNLSVPNETRLRLLKLKTERRSIVSDRPWWVDREPNFVRLAMAVQRGAVILGRDHVKLLANYQQPGQVNA